MAQAICAFALRGEGTNISETISFWDGSSNFSSSHLAPGKERRPEGRRRKKGGRRRLPEVDAAPASDGAKMGKRKEEEKEEEEGQTATGRCMVVPRSWSALRRTDSVSTG